jgi:hypothetical protein
MIYPASGIHSRLSIGLLLMATLFTLTFFLQTQHTLHESPQARLQYTHKLVPVDTRHYTHMSYPRDTPGMSSLAPGRSGITTMQKQTALVKQTASNRLNHLQAELHSMRNNDSTPFNDLKKSHPEPSLFDGCTHVYLDMGSNIGVQVRKLFEPECYPGSNLYTEFLKDTSAQERSVCAVGFEPNKMHTDRLRRVERHLQKRGFRASFFTETGVGGRDGFETMSTDNDVNNHFWGFGTARRAGSESLRVRIMNAGKFIHDNITPMRPRPKVFIKLDVEGSEYETLASMLAWGSFRFIDEIWVEWHPEEWAARRWNVAASPAGTPSELQLGLKHSLTNALDIITFAGAKAKVVPRDDESYLHDTRVCEMADL